MLRLVKTIMGGLVALSLVFAASSAFAKEEKKPDATIDFKSTQVSFIVGLGWGKGKVVFKETEYPIKARGFEVLSAGVAVSDMTGYVYNLKNIEDVEGNYTTIGASASVGAGASTNRAKNENGVIMEVWSKDKGVEFKFGGSGVTVDLVGKGKDFSKSSEILNQ